MKGFLTLTEAININDIIAGSLNLIEAPCGSGKTYFAVNHLIKLASKPWKALYLIDTTIGRMQLMQEKSITYYSPEWLESLPYESAVEIGTPLFAEDKMPVMTYHTFGMLIQQYPRMTDNLEVIICDEFHNAFIFGNIKEKDKETNPAKIAHYAIENLVKLDMFVNKRKVIALTATPNMVRARFDHTLIHTVVVNENVKRLEEREVILFPLVDNLLHALDKSKVTLLYTTHISQIIRICDRANGMGFSAIGIWSLSPNAQAKYPMTKEQFDLRDYIINEQAIPPQYNLVCINASCGTGVNIKEKNGIKINCVVVNHSVDDIVTQVRGRARNDIDILYRLDKNAEDNIPYEVPVEYVGIPLYDKEKRELIAYFDIRNKKNDPTAWPTLKGKLEAVGYAITTHEGKVIALDGNKKRRSYDIINY